MKYSLLFVFLLICSLGYTQLECNEEGCKFCIKNTKVHCSQNSGWKASWFQSVPQKRSIDLMQENQNKYANNETNESIKRLIINSESQKVYSIQFPSSYTDNLQFKFELCHEKVIKGDFKLVLVDVENNEFTFDFSKQEEDSLMMVTCHCNQDYQAGFKVKLNDRSPFIFSFDKNETLWFMKIKQNPNEKEIPLRFFFDSFQDIQFNINFKKLSPKLKSIKFSSDKLKKGYFWAISDLSIYNQLKNSEKDLIQNQSVHSDISIQSGKTQSDNTYTSGNKIFALYIYNSDYINNEILSKLSNPGKDAKALDRALKSKIGEEFYSSDSIFNLKTNQMNLREILKPERIEKMNGKDIIIVHFGGHGFSLDGINHWVPIDFDGVIKETNNPKFDLNTLEGRKNETKKQVNDDLRYSITPYILLERLNNSLEDKIIIVISDACRNEIKFKFENEPPLSSDRGVVISDENNSITPDFDHSQSNSKKNHLFLQYSVKNNQTANDNNSYTKVLSQKINSKEDILYKFDGNFNNILIEPFKIISPEKSSSPKTNNIALLLNDFNFMVTPWKEYLRNNPK